MHLQGRRVHGTVTPQPGRRGQLALIPSKCANSLAAAVLTTNYKLNCVCMQAALALVLCRLLLPWQL